MTRRTIRFTSAAREHVRTLKRWWRENRSHPDIPGQDIEEALGILGVLPAVGSQYPSSPVPGTRRLYLDRLMCHLYYTFDEKEEVDPRALACGEWAPSSGRTAF